MVTAMLSDGLLQLLKSSHNILFSPQKRALKLQQKRQKEDLEREQQREKELEREKQLTAKPAKRT